MEVKEGEWYAVVVGMYNKTPVFLVAPAGIRIAKDDVVISGGGLEYSVVFSADYVEPTDRLFVALNTVLGGPLKIAWHMSKNKVEWEADKNEDTTNAPCCDDCRCGS